MLVINQSGRIGADEEIDETKGKSLKQIEEAIEEKDLKIGTQILETVSCFDSLTDKTFISLHLISASII